jgi:hypothetical protein
MSDGRRRIFSGSKFVEVATTVLVDARLKAEIEVTAHKATQ